MLYNKILTLCAAKQMSIRKLERESGLGNGTVNKWSEGRTPSASNLISVAKVLDTTVEELLAD